MYNDSPYWDPSELNRPTHRRRIEYPRPPAFNPSSIGLPDDQIRKAIDLDLNIQEASKVILDIKKFFNVHTILDGTRTLPLVALYYRSDDIIPNIIKKMSLQISPVESYQIVQLPYSAIQTYLKSIEKS